MIPLVTLAAIWHCSILFAAATQYPVVSIDAGTLHGGTCSGDSGAAYFKSIPYAQSPTGQLRFMPPKPYDEKFSQLGRNATIPAPACIQFGDFLAEPPPASEDCLYLDIWTPANATESSGLPVRAWLYGGRNLAGGISDPVFDGCHVPATDAIMVSINYRVGPLGFLALPEAGVKGNQAVQDILLALGWIQNNIAAFGGDPNKVLLHGQSAGAVNTFTIASLPQAPRLLNAAIMQSGGGRDAPLKDSAYELGNSYAKALNCSSDNLACLQRQPIRDLKMAIQKTPVLYSPLPLVFSNNITTPGFQPYVDGEIITEQPSFRGVQVPSILGSNALEGTLFGFSQFAPTGGPANVSAKDYEIFLQESFGNDAASVEKAYPLSSFNSTPYPPFFAISKVLSDAEYICPTYRGLNRAFTAGKKVPVWTYFWSHAPQCPWLQQPYDSQSVVRLLGPTHTAEIPFVLGNTHDLPQPNGTCTMDPAELAISAFLNDAWTSMAATGDPTRSAADRGRWPVYGGAKDPAGINIVNSTIELGLVDYSMCELWDRIEDKLLRSISRGVSMNSTSSSTLTSTSSATNSTGTSIAAFTGGSSSVIRRGGEIWRSGVTGLVMALCIGMLGA